MGDVKVDGSEGKTTLSTKPIGKDGKPLKPCCVCLDTKGQRDEWYVSK